MSSSLAPVASQQEQPDAKKVDIAEEDDRNLVDLLVDQIEFANVILLNKIDVAPKDDVAFLRNLVQRLNPEAKVSPDMGSVCWCITVCCSHAQCKSNRCRCACAVLHWRNVCTLSAIHACIGQMCAHEATRMWQCYITC